MTEKTTTVKMGAFKTGARLARKKPLLALALIGTPIALIYANIAGGSIDVTPVNPPAAEAPAKPGLPKSPKDVTGPAFDKNAGQENKGHDHSVDCSSSISSGSGGIAVRSTLDGGAFAGDWLAYTLKSDRGTLAGWSPTPDFTITDPKGIAQGKNVHFEESYKFPFGNKTSFVGCDTENFLSAGELDTHPRPGNPGEAIVALTVMPLTAQE
jgi:hypothetical protein